MLKTSKMDILERFLKDAKKDNVINSVMLEKLSYRIQFYRKDLNAEIMKSEDLRVENEMLKKIIMDKVHYVDLLKFAMPKNYTDEAIRVIVNRFVDEEADKFIATIEN